MSATGYINSWLLVLLLAATGLAQGEPQRVMLGEITIKGEVSQPSVSIISSRIQPEFRRLQVEKSFLTEIRQPSAKVLQLNADVRVPHKIKAIEQLLFRERHYQPTREKE
jgi:hypothetical protein